MLRSLAKRFLPESLQLFTKKHLHQAALYTWPTKSYETWLVLQNLLYAVRPVTLVEFGSGRSTNYLAEYSSKFQARLVSFEQNLSWTNKVNRALRLAFFSDKTVVHASLRREWYDERVVARHLAEFPNIEFLFLDGPAAFANEQRDSAGLRRQVWPRLNWVKMIIIDDVHRSDCHQLAGKLAGEFKLKRFDIVYNTTNKLAFILSPVYVSAIDQLPSELKKLLTPVTEEVVWSGV